MWLVAMHVIFLIRLVCVERRGSARSREVVSSPYFIAFHTGYSFSCSRVHIIRHQQVRMGKRDTNWLDFGEANLPEPYFIVQFS